MLKCEAGDYTKTRRYAIVDLLFKALAVAATAILGSAAFWWQWHSAAQSVQKENDAAVLLYLDEQTRVVEVTSVLLSALTDPAVGRDREVQKRWLRYAADELSPSKYSLAQNPWMDRHRDHEWLTITFAKRDSFGLVPDARPRELAAPQRAAMRIISTILRVRTNYDEIGAIRISAEPQPGISFFKTYAQLGSHDEKKWKDIHLLNWGVPDDPLHRSALNIMLRPAVPMQRPIDDGSVMNSTVAWMDDTVLLTNLRDSAADHVNAALNVFPRLGRDYIEIREKVRTSVGVARSSMGSTTRPAI